jgi:glyoxylase-like metal-dependent hydrolase (beta-lactamase superfamily II)
VTEADAWVLDPASGVLAAGDLVTFPVPLLDTACAPGWQAALARLSAAPFRVLVPGHGPPLTRAQLAIWRTGFDHLVACAASDAAEEACVAGWLQELGPLVPEAEHAFARTLLGYYVGARLRAPPEERDRACGGG